MTVPRMMNPMIAYIPIRRKFAGTLFIVAYHDFDSREQEFCFGIAANAKQVDKGNCAKHQGDEAVDAERARLVPILDCQGSSDKLKWQEDKPCGGSVSDLARLSCVAVLTASSVDPAERKAPSRIQETRGVGAKGSRHGVEDSHLGKALQRKVQHYASDGVCDNGRGGTTFLEDQTRANEETSALTTGLVQCLFYLIAFNLPMVPPRAIICMCLFFSRLSRGWAASLSKAFSAS